MSMYKHIMTTSLCLVVMQIVCFAILRGVVADVISNIICDQIKKNQSVLNMNLRGAFIFKENLILLSNDWLVYEVPNVNFENSYGQMLFNVSSVPLETKWPAFNSPRFQQIKGRIANIYSLHFRDQLIYFDVYREMGIVYNIDRNEIGNGIRYDPPPGLTADACITSTDRMYSINYNSQGQMVFVIWKMQQNHWGYLMWATRSRDVYMYYSADRQNILIKRYPDYSLTAIRDWNLPPGFVHKQYFHFFDRSRVYIFENNFNSYGDVLLESPLKIVDAKDFFVCEKTMKPVTYPPVTTPMSKPSNETTQPTVTMYYYSAMFAEKSKSMSKGQMIGFALIGISILALIVLLIFMLLSKTPKKSHHHHKKSTRSARKSSKNLKDKSERGVPSQMASKRSALASQPNIKQLSATNSRNKFPVSGARSAQTLRSQMP